MIRNARLLLAALLCLAVGPAVVGGSGQQPKTAQDLMRKKLAHSQKVLEALALNDFAAIRTHAEELILIAKDVQWRIVKSPRYELHSNEFMRACEGLIEKAREKNTDGAALSYVDLTLSCVRCHKYVREQRDTRLNEPARDFRAEGTP